MERNIEEVINWTLPGLTLYYRDSDLPPECVSNYRPGSIIMSRAFIDVTSRAGKPTKNTRFAIASSKAAPVYEVMPDGEKYRLHALLCNSFFKVLDVYKKEGITQVLLLHIPSSGIEFFRRTVFILGQENLEDEFKTMARQSLDTKLAGPVVQALEDQEWVDRTSFPIGQSDDYNLYPLEPVRIPLPLIQMMIANIRRMTNDEGPMNDPFFGLDATTQQEETPVVPQPEPRAE